MQHSVLDRIYLAFLLILILSSLLLHTGLFVGQYSSIYDEKAEKTHEADVLSYVPGSDEEISRALSGVKEISEFSVQDMISPGSPEVTINDSAESIELDGATITRYGEYGAAEPYRMIECDESVTEQAVYLNSYYAKKNHIHVGDIFHIHFKTTGDLDLKVAGIFEALIGGNAYGWMEIMVDEDTFAGLQLRAEEVFQITNMNANKKMVKIYAASGYTQNETMKAATDAFASGGIDYYIYERDLAKAGYVAVSDILSGLVTAFSVVVLAVCLIMIVFTINNNIDRDIKNIGALRAVGHTRGQIRAALV